MPGSAFGSSLVGNGLNFSIEGGYAGISATANASTIGWSILLGYGGNKLGSGLGNLAGKYMNAGGFWNNYTANIFGNYVGNGGQFILENANR